MPTLLEVRPLPAHRLWLRYDDGVEGAVDLSDLAGRGVFQAWNEAGLFESVRIGPQGEVAWGERLDLCPDALYLRLTGQTPEELFFSLKKAEVGA